VGRYHDLLASFHRREAALCARLNQVAYAPPAKAAATAVVKDGGDDGEDDPIPAAASEVDAEVKAAGAAWTAEAAWLRRLDRAIHAHCRSAPYLGLYLGPYLGPYLYALAIHAHCRSALGIDRTHEHTPSRRLRHLFTTRNSHRAPSLPSPPLPHSYPLFREQVILTAAREADRERARVAVLSLLQRLWHPQLWHIELIPFGSSVNGLGSPGSDLDLCLVVHPTVVRPEKRHRGLFTLTHVLGCG